MNAPEDAAEKRFSGRVAAHGPLGAANMSFTMASEPPATAQVFFKALMLARAAGAREIGIAHLLAALDAPPVTRESVRPAVLEPVEKQELPLSPRAAAVVQTLGDDIFSIPVDTFRRALLAASCEDEQ